jgi:hypothetical protein
MAANEVIEIFVKFYLPIVNGLVDAKRYDYHIRPVVVIFEVIINAFQGNYLQLSQMCNDNSYTIKTLFKSLVQLICSIKLEDYQSYIKKTFVTFDIIKIIFCDYIQYAELEDKSYFDTVMNLIVEGVDSLDNKCIMKCHTIVMIFLKS